MYEKNENQQQSKSDSYPHSKSQNMEKNELREEGGFRFGGWKKR
jgi:hypothetical protein